MQEKMSTIRKKINSASGTESTEKHVGSGLKICATRGRPGGTSKKPMVAPDDCFRPYDTRKVVLVAMGRHAEHNFQSETGDSKASPQPDRDCSSDAIVYDQQGGPAAAQSKTQKVQEWWARHERLCSREHESFVWQLLLLRGALRV